MLKKLVCIALSISMISMVTTFAAQLQQELPETPELVSVVKYQPITDQQQLLELAMEQYEERITERPATYSRTAAQPEEIVATQVLQEELYSDGTGTRTVSNTALLVLDEYGNKLSAAEYDYRVKHYTTDGSWPGEIYGSLELCVDENIGGNAHIIGKYVKAATGYSYQYKVSMIETRYHVVEELAYERTNQVQQFSSPKPAQVCQMTIKYQQPFELNKAKGNYALASAWFYNNKGLVDKEPDPKQYALVIDVDQYYKT